MSNTISAFEDEYASEDLPAVTDDALKASVVELSSFKRRFDAEYIRRIGELDRRGCVETDGFLSVVSWLKTRCREAAGRAGDVVRLARSLRTMPHTAAAFEDGEIGVEAVRPLADAAGRHPDTFAEHEEMLVEIVCGVPTRDIRRAVEYWSQAADPDQALERHRAQHRRRRLSISTTFGGMVRIDGELDPETGQLVTQGFRAAETGATDPADHRTPTQRRADALADLARHFLEHGPTGTHHGQKPHVSVLIDLATLEQRAPGVSEALDGTVFHPDTVRRYCCDANLTRILTDGPSQPLDVGRTTRTIPPAIWNALVLRDRGCVWEGCDAPPEWCDAHHLKHWIDGGPTSLDNLVLLCRRHHRMLHEGQHRSADHRGPPLKGTPRRRAIGPAIPRLPIPPPDEPGQRGRPGPGRRRPAA